MKNLTILFSSLLMIFGCSSNSINFSSRDLNPEERISLIHSKQTRSPASPDNSCSAIVIDILEYQSKANKKPKATLPELSQLQSEKRKFPNGKKYILYKADVNVMQNYEEYKELLENTVEVVFRPTGPFGHIDLRIGKKLYSFNNVQWTSIGSFSPRMFGKSMSDEMPNAYGYVFEVGKEKIETVIKDIEKIYMSSMSNNVPPFDAFSPMLKIVEENGGLRYISESPSFGNSRSINGKIVTEGKNYFLETSDGMRVEVIKKKNEYYTQSYSCSYSAGHVLERFFGIEVTYAGSAKGLSESLINGNIDGTISPKVVFKYYED